MDYYKILEIPRTSKPKDIKAAYRRLALKYHPDKNHSPNAIEKFKQIGEAYQILSNPEQKRLYDSKIDTSPVEHIHSDPSLATFQFQTPEELFRQFFHEEDPLRNLFGDDLEEDIFSSREMQFNLDSKKTVSAASRMTSTTTKIVNGQTHTITKIIDSEGTRIIEDYGDGRQRVTLNGKEEVAPFYSNKPFASIDISREYGEHFVDDEEAEERYRQKSPFYELCSRIFCCF